MYRLRIVLDERYPNIIREAGLAMAGVRPSGSMAVGLTQSTGCIVVGAYWKHWPCLFPPYGRGMKHDRRIQLTGWQQAIADRHPESLLRGLIHSDGCRAHNVVNGKDYPRYMFTNHSEDIRRLFQRACDLYGVRWRPTNWCTVAVSRRPDVERLDAVIGPKA